MMNETIEKLEELIECCEKLKNAYFWQGGNVARRTYIQDRYTIPKFIWEEGGHTYSAEVKVECTQMNVYVQKWFTKDGKKTTLRAIKNSYDRLLEEY